MVKYNSYSSFDDVSKTLDMMGGFNEPKLIDEIEKTKTRITGILNDSSKGEKFVRSFQRRKSKLFKELFINNGKSVPSPINDYFFYMKSFYEAYILGDGNPISSFNKFLEDINGYIDQLSKPEEEIELGNGKVNNIKKLVSDIGDETEFNAGLKEVQEKLLNVGMIYYLRECIRQGKEIKAVMLKSSGFDMYRENDKDLFWEMRNVYMISSSKLKMLELENGLREYKPETEPKAFSLSGSLNAFAELGLIEKHLESGGTIKAISGTSMGGLIAVLLGKIIKGNKRDLDRIKQLKKRLTNPGIWERFKGGKLELGKKDANSFFDLFMDIAKEFGINKETTFDDLNIPVLINARRQRGEGAQEILFGGRDNVVDSIKLSANYDGSIFPDIEFQGESLYDYNGSEQNNPINALKIMGIKGEDIIMIDTGSGSSYFNKDTIGTSIIRLFYRPTTERDLLDKMWLKKEGGTIYEVDIADIKEGLKGDLMLKGVIDIVGRVGATAIKELINYGRSLY